MFEEWPRSQREAGANSSGRLFRSLDFFLLWSETTGGLGLGFLGFFLEVFLALFLTTLLIYKSQNMLLKKKNTIQWFLAIHYIMQQSSKSILEHFHHFQKRHQTS